MIDTTLFRLRQRQGTAEAREQQAEQWRLDHTEAMAVRDLEDLIADAVQLADDVNKLIRLLFDRLGKNELSEVFLVGDLVRSLLEISLRGCRSLLARAGAATAGGFTVKGVPALESAVRRLDRLQAWLPQAWPIAGELFDPTDMEAAVQEDGPLLTHDEFWQKRKGTP